MMLSILILLFTILPALELYVLIKVGTVIGALNTIAIIIITGILGAFLARLQGFLVLRKIQENVAQGILPSSELLDAALILIGGLLLLTPGFITDVFGFCLLLAPMRLIIKFFLKKRLEGMMKEGQAVHFTWHQSSQNNIKYKDIDIS
ncbi:MAG TPA: FxsA family protein [Candidatus Omnitrophota bacterium]|nr:FxsA family protein [Candidatus Omnitrophota bacterium]